VSEWSWLCRAKDAVWHVTHSPWDMAVTVTPPGWSAGGEVWHEEHLLSWAATGSFAAWQLMHKAVSVMVLLPAGEWSTLPWVGRVPFST